MPHTKITVTTVKPTKADVIFEVLAVGDFFEHCGYTYMKTEIARFSRDARVFAEGKALNLFGRSIADFQSECRVKPLSNVTITLIEE